MKKGPSKFKKFFSPDPNAPFIRWIAPYAAFAVIGLAVFFAVLGGWSYTNSSQFCGTTCHTMPPQYNTYLRSPHSRVTCVECHIGRDDLTVVVPRKVQHSKTVYAMLFHTYEYPIVAKEMRPANEACETCHFPTKFTTDTLTEIHSHENDEANTVKNIFLLLKTGGGSKREGLGKGIHWHIENKVTFLATDELEQNIPYVKVQYDDGTVQEYYDISANLQPENIQSNQLKNMDCITCHNRSAHSIPSPASAVDTALNIGTISKELPYVRKQAVELLSVDYKSQAEADAAFNGLADFYQKSYPAVAQSKKDLIQNAVDFMKSTYAQSHFVDQKLEWSTHPDNIGHSQFAGCFRCHDGKHITKDGTAAVRLECNLCHSVPQTSDASAFTTNVSINNGAEPSSHTHTLWIALHGKAIDQTCAQCHPPADPKIDYTKLNGQKPPVDGSFCGNSLCHQSDWKFAAFNDKALQPILQQQLVEAKKLNQP